MKATFPAGMIVVLKDNLLNLRKGSHPSILRKIDSSMNDASVFL